MYFKIRSLNSIGLLLKGVISRQHFLLNGKRKTLRLDFHTAIKLIGPAECTSQILLQRILCFTMCKAECTQNQL